MDRRVAYPLGHFIWTRSFVRAFGVETRPFIVGGKRGRELAVVAPLVAKRHHGTSRLFLASAGELGEPMDLAWTDERALERLVVWLVRSGRPLYFERIIADSPTVRKLKRAYRGRGIVIVHPHTSCPYITLDDSWVDPESHLSAGRRSELRRARSMAEQSGPTATEIHAPDLNELPQLLDTALEVEARSWKGDAGMALVRDAHRAAFYRQYAEAACVEGNLRICFLRIGDRVAAMQLAIEEDSGFWLLKVGYDARFAQCSPGLLLMRDTIRYAAEAGLKSYEFLGQAESWAQVWTSSERACVSIRVYPFGLRGLSALTADAAVAICQRWGRK